MNEARRLYAEWIVEEAVMKLKSKFSSFAERSSETFALNKLHKEDH